jgi:hypothetical protein
MIEAKIARVKELIRRREEIDAELETFFGGGEGPKRGRPRKGHTVSVSVGHSAGHSVSTSIDDAGEGSAESNDKIE